MRIGVVCFPSLGGSGIVATEIAVELARRGHQLDVISSDTPWRFGEGRFGENRFGSQAGDVLFHRVPTHPAPADTYTVALAATIAQLAPRLDILHVHYAVPHAAAAQLALSATAGKKPKWVTTLHGTDVTRALQPVLRHSLIQSDALTTPSRFLAESAVAAFALDVAPTVIHNFVDPARFAPGKASVNEPVVLHASNFRAVKRVSDIVSAFARVRDRMPCQLWLVGEGDERTKIEEQARPLGSAVRFLGPRHDMASLLQSARVYMQASEQEAFGLAALEAQSAGVPVVSTRVGGVPEVVADGVSGTLVPLGDVAAMAEALHALLSDSALHQRMSEAARARVLAKFVRQDRVSEYEALFSSLLSSP